MRKVISSSLASASALVLAMAIGPAVAEPERGSAAASDASQATITVDDCTVESSKDISYIAFLDDGTQVDKNETIEGDSYDLTEFDGIDEIDTIEVKAGTTAETFDVDCTTEDGATGGEGAPDRDDDETDSGDDRFSSQGNSEADVTLADCTVESSKDISYIAFLDDGTQVDKNETIEGDSYDLTEFDGIDEIDTIEVKSGTTAETFDVDCATEDGATGGTGESGTDEETDDEPVASEGSSEATIELAGCVVESSKDISYIAFLDDGTEVDKDETIEGDSYKLTEFDGIDEIDTIEVKSGTTVETFAIDCTTDGDTTAGAGDPEEEVENEEPGEEEEPSEEEEQGDETETDDGSDDESDVEDSSAAQITLDGCTVESSKDISYIAYSQDGEEVKKENINAPSYDLTQVDGIDEIDTIEVKSGTTVEEFDINCTSA